MRRDRDPRACHQDPPSPETSFETLLDAWRGTLEAALRRQARADAPDGAPDDDLDNDFDEAIREAVRKPSKEARTRLESFFDAPPLALVGFETPGIQSYLFRVMRPVDIEGGSRRVDGFVQLEGELSLVPKLRQRGLVDDGQILFLGGGGGLLVAAAHEAPALVRALEDHLEQETKGDLFTTAVAVPAWPWDLEGEPSVPRAGLERFLGPLDAASPYARTLAILQARLQDRRTTRPRRLASLPGPRVHERCDACARRLGKERGREQGKVVRLCDGCHSRRQLARSKKLGEALVASYEKMVENLGDGWQAYRQAHPLSVPLPRSMACCGGSRKGSSTPIT